MSWFEVRLTQTIVGRVIVQADSADEARHYAEVNGLTEWERSHPVDIHGDRVDVDWVRPRPDISANDRRP